MVFILTFGHMIMCNRTGVTCSDTLIRNHHFALQLLSALPLVSYRDASILTFWSVSLTDIKIAVMADS